MRTARTFGVVAGVVAVVVTAGAMAWAAIPGPNGVINSCYARTDGALRVIDPKVDNCTKDENSLDWNQQGPTGPAGPAGPAGRRGPTGPAGASRLPREFSVAVGSAAVTNQYQTAASLNLPPGTWFVSAKSMIGNYPDTYWACQLRHGAIGIDGGGGQTSPQASSQTVVMQAVTGSDTQFPVSMGCQTLNARDIRDAAMFRISIIAIEVASATNTAQ